VVRTFIYGSCVSRDTFEFLDRKDFSLLRYVARSSLISALSPPAPVPLPEGHGLSPFQLRQVKTDASSSMLPLLRDLSDKIDLLLWDLVDERLGFYADDEGHVVTDSIELRRVGDHAGLAGYRHVPFGSAEHLDQFRSSLGPWRRFLDELGLLDRLVVVALPWATLDVEGKAAPASFGITGGEGNRLFAPYYAAIREEVGAPLIGQGLPARTDEAHKWGPAPFHYSTQTYLGLRDQLVGAAGQRTQRATHE
jgi:hypothetical protein